MSSFPATREAGLRRLEEFLPLAGSEYTAGRNHVPGTVSRLSPYVRHRLVSEEEIARAVLDHHGHAAAEKFLQELCWRTYWKGWLELRPAVWKNYLRDLDALRASMARVPELAARVAAAEEGQTGNECLDAWTRELRATGWLHNHVRMWFASLWIHALRLPWQIGADFFLRHLLDGDPASNTLSWRWVCGLQTRGKVYRATAENIAKYTGGRFHPTGLDAGEDLPIPEEEPIPSPGFLPQRDPLPRGNRALLITTVEDITPEQWGVDTADVTGIVIVNAAVPGASETMTAFRQEALGDAAQRAAAFFNAPVTIVDPGQKTASEILLDLCIGAEELVLMAPSVGLLPEGWEGILPSQLPLRRIRREWDSAFWPHATHGFFRFREQIPSVLRKLP